MAFKLNDRVWESSTSTGIGDISLSGSRQGYQTFAASLSNGDTTYYTVVADNGAWETGLGTYNSGTNSITRDVVYNNSSGNTNKISFAAGAKEVFLSLPADGFKTSSDIITYSQNGVGAVRRSIENKLRESVSVKDFGAVGDGVTDDTAAIQSAIAAASLRGDAGAVVYFPGSPTEYVMQPITLTDPKQRVRFVGDGEQASSVKIEGGATGAGTYGLNCNFSDSSWLEFENIQFRAYSAYDAVIRINVPQNNVLLRRTLISANSLCKYCVYINSGSMIHIDDCYTTGATEFNYYTKDQSTANHLLITGGNNDIATLGIMYVDSTFAGPFIDIIGGRYEGAASKNLFQFATSANGNIKIIGSIITNGAANSIIYKVSGSTPRWYLQFSPVNSPVNIVLDPGTPSNDVQFVSGALNSWTASDNWLFKDLNMRGTTSVDAKIRMARASNTVYSTYADATGWRVRDETNSATMLTGTRYRIGTEAARWAATALSPAQITADQNDYDPGRNGFWRLSSDASRTITGIAGGENGSQLDIVNIGSQDIVLAHQNASSTAANRIISPTGSSITLGASKTAVLRYDATTQRWRIMSYT